MLNTSKKLLSAFILVLSLPALANEVVKRGEWSVVPDYARLVARGDITPEVKKSLISLHHTGSMVARGGEILAGSAAPLARSIVASHLKAPFAFADVGYHFLISQQGVVYEARSLDYLGAHTKGLNTENIGVAFMGCYDEEGCGEFTTRFTDAALKATAHLIANLAQIYGFEVLDLDEKVVARSAHDVNTNGMTRFPYSPGNLVVARMMELIALAQCLVPAPVEL